MNNNRQGPGGPQRGRGPEMGRGFEPGGFGNHGPHDRGMNDRPSMHSERHEPPRDREFSHQNGSMGSGLLGVLGAGIAAVVNAQEQAKEQEYQREQEIKRQEEAARVREAEEKKAQQELLEKLPAVCPYCGAPTSGKITCEFCGSNLISKVSQ